MRKFLIFLTGSLAFVSAPLAGEAQGTIAAVNPNAMTVTLDNGETYKLPPEFDPAIIMPGMVIALAHEEDAAKTVTDMEQLD